MSLISQLQDESLSQPRQKAWCNEEASNATGKREGLEADIAKCSSSFVTAASKSSVLDAEISSLQSELGVLSKKHNGRWKSCAKLNGTYSPKSKPMLEPFGTTR